MTKKTLTISAIILILLALALGAYYFLISANDPTSPAGSRPFFGNLFPFGNNSVVTEEIPFATSTPIVDDIAVGTFEQRVRLISNEPVAGSVFIATTTGDTIRYIEKATGHIFDVLTYENNVARISNTTIPQIHKALFTENGTGFVAQYTRDSDRIETFYGKLIGTSTEKRIEGRILSPSIYSFVVSPNTTSIFTLEATNEGSEGYIQTLSGANKRLVWSSPLKGFIPSFISDTFIGLTSKPHFSAEGSMTRINTSNGAQNIVIPNEANLTALPHTKRPLILYANNERLLIKNTTTGAIIEISPKTFPEKCVWATNSAKLYCAVSKQVITLSSLYAWYKGEVSYSDDIWEYDTETSISQKIVDLRDLSGRDIDVVSPSINTKDSFLLIENKRDGSLWSVKIN